VRRVICKAAGYKVTMKGVMKLKFE